MVLTTLGTVDIYFKQFLFSVDKGTVEYQPLQSKPTISNTDQQFRFAEVNLNPTVSKFKKTNIEWEETYEDLNEEMGDIIDASGASSLVRVEFSTLEDYDEFEAMDKVLTHIGSVDLSTWAESSSGRTVYLDIPPDLVPQAIKHKGKYLVFKSTKDREPLINGDIPETEHWYRIITKVAVAKKRQQSHEQIGTIIRCLPFGAAREKIVIYDFSAKSKMYTLIFYDKEAFLAFIKEPYHFAKHEGTLTPNYGKMSTNDRELARIKMSGIPSTVAIKGIHEKYAEHGISFMCVGRIQTFAGKPTNNYITLVKT